MFPNVSKCFQNVSSLIDEKTTEINIKTITDNGNKNICENQYEKNYPKKRAKIEGKRAKIEGKRAKIEEKGQKLREYFRCENCNYKTLRMDNFTRHNNSKKHKALLVIKDKQYKCSICEISFSSKYKFERHINTKKHALNILKSNKTETNNKTKNKILYICDICNKQYKTRSGLYKHNLVCNKNEENTTNEDRTNAKDLTEIKNIVMELAKSNEILQKIVHEPRIIGNNNNNTYNIDNYLNIECKDAINMSDFIRQIQITLNDLLYLGENGFTKSIHNLFISTLQDMEQNKRPIHCTNKKKKTLYIKDEDVWKKDKENRKMEQTIHKLHQKELTHAIDIMDENAEFFQEYDNIVKKNNIIIGLTTADKKEALKSITKTISNSLLLEQVKR